MPFNVQTATDEELVQECLNNVGQFEFLMERYQKKLLYYIMRISHFELEEAEEILQEAFLKVWMNLNDFDERVKFSSWIYRIVHNETISNYRKWKTRGGENRSHVEDEVFGQFADQIDLEDELNQQLNNEMVQQTLNRLPLKYREVLVLKFIEDKSYDEISDILKKPSGTVATLINRAKKQFQSSLQLSQTNHE